MPEGAVIGFWRRLEPLARRVLVIGALAFLIAVAGGVHSCRLARTAKTEAKLSQDQTEAALKSGADAVDTVGGVGTRAAETDRQTMENADDIRKAPGADVPVSDDVHAAGMRALCKRAAYRGKPECVQFAPAR